MENNKCFGLNYLYIINIIVLYQGCTYLEGVIYWSTFCLGNVLSTKRLKLKIWVTPKRFKR